MGRGVSKVLGGIARSTRGLPRKNEQGRWQKGKGLTHVSIMHRKHRCSGDDIERWSSNHCAQNISQQKTTETKNTTQLELEREVGSAKEWEAARQQLLVKEKKLTRARDALAAERRRMPWVAVEQEYEFDGPQGKASL